MRYEFDGIEYYTETDVINLGFTKGMIEEFLPAPVIKTNIYHKYGPKMHLYKVEDVESVMETEECKEKLEKAKIRRKKMGDKRREINERKREKLVEEITEAVMKVEVPIITEKELKKRTLKAKQKWYDEQHSRNWKRYDYTSAYTADEKTIKRWEVNYVRHRLTNYEGLLNQIKGCVGVNSAYYTLKDYMLDKSAEAYPYLQEECIRQQGYDMYYER